MALAQYRAVLAIPGVRSFTLLMAFVRVPIAAVTMVLTLHVVIDLGRGYAAAGVAGAALTVGACLGGPVLGRIADARGMRTMLVICTIGEAGFWCVSPLLPYPALLLGAFLGGLVGIPTFSISRQALAALAPPDLRRAAYSLDSVTAELAFMAGPALGVTIATLASGTAALLALGATITVAGIALHVSNPPTRSDGELLDTARAHWRSWVTPALLSLLCTALGATIALTGMDVAIIAALRPIGQLSWVGAVNGVICASSAVGGLVYGTMRRRVSPRLAMALLGLLEIPAGLATGQWWLLMLALIPASALCAPTVTAIGDELSRLAPPSVRGLVMGLQGSAFTLGGAIGAPLAGVVADHHAPGLCFAVVGATGAAVAGAAVLLSQVSPRKTTPSPAPVPQPG